MPFAVPLAEMEGTQPGYANRAAVCEVGVGGSMPLAIRKAIML